MCFQSKIKWCRYSVYGLFAMALIMFAAMASAQTRAPLKPAAAKGPPGSNLAAAIRFDNGLLSVRIKGLPLSQILSEIVRQGNLTLVSYGPLDENISIEFKNLSLEEGLRRILRHHSFALAHAPPEPDKASSTASPSRKLWIIPRGNGAPARRSRRAAVRRPAPAPAAVVGNDAVADAARPETDFIETPPVGSSGESDPDDLAESLQSVLEELDEESMEKAMEILSESEDPFNTENLARLLREGGVDLTPEAREALKGLSRNNAPPLPEPYTAERQSETAEED